MTMSDDVVHNRIAVLRTDRRVSRRELAKALGVHYQTVGYLERGEYAPSLHHKERCRIRASLTSFIRPLGNQPTTSPTLSTAIDRTCSA